ncbi:MAG: hypothetical protein CVU44_12830 [Chloroflexi bacterium HGW-Chloroflexi-6]|nr:MAG: hypothetical protein CVU44_12830 [Chloroflexi bacterium HGW-Chloroflexi-6]
MKKNVLVLLAFMLAACQPDSMPTESASPRPSSSPTSIPQETPDPTVTPFPIPTEIPADWQTFHSQDLKLSLRYPPIWQTNGENRASGPGGFWQIESQRYARSLYDQLSHLCVQEANDPNLNTRYGEMPFIYDWQGWDIKQNLWFGYGCIVSPNLPQPGLESVLFARNPARPDELLILRADSTHFDGILSSLSFLQAAPEPTYSGYYDSPHCREIPSVLAISSQQAAGLTITEYAITNDTCHPIRHLDGFRTRINALDVKVNTLWSQSEREKMQATNRDLAAFGLRLEERQTAQPWASFDLKKGDETIFSRLVGLGEVSIRPDGKDFIFWARAEDGNGSQFPIMVTREGVQPLSFWEFGFDRVWAGNRLLSFNYSETEVFPVGAPARMEIFADGQPLQTLSIPHMSSAGSPMRGLWAWDGHWVTEIRSVLFVDGLPKNQEWGYTEIFDWHLVNGKPFFAARRASDFSLVYDGLELPVTYKDIAHGDVCCETGMYDFQPLAGGAFFYARRDGVWFGVLVQPVKE